MEANIVTEWLISLRLGQYADSFIDNGYDDLEICKQIGDPDLDAIGVFTPAHRNRLLQSVRTLREEGAASVYFSLEEAEKSTVSEEANLQDPAFLSSSTNNSETDRHSTCSRTSGSDKGPSAPPMEEVSTRYLDEYEEGKAELVKIPRVQLKVLLKEQLVQDGVKLNLQPYSNQMVRDYKKKPGSRGYKNYTEAQLEEAVSKVVEGSMSMRTASQQYKIPFGTLNNKYHGRYVRVAGGQPVFSQAEEVAILNSVVKCADWGFPLTMLELRMFAKSFLDQAGRKVEHFQNNLPGKDWVRSLLKRHKTRVAQRVSANINKARASISRDTITKYFDNLKDTVKDIPPQNIFNYDETNVSDEPGKGKGIYRRGVKYPEKIANHSKSATTIMVCGSADGTLLPPYIIYKSQHLYNTWRENGPKGYPCCNKACCAGGCRFNRTSHGWMDSSTFQDWFESSFLPHARRLEGKKVLIGDNLASHFSETIIRQCEENDVAFVCLVPHSTHICQPLDVSFFRPMKTAWRATLTNYKMKHSRQSGIPKEVFPSLLRESLEKMDLVSAQTKHKSGDGKVSAIKRNLINGFEATGIYPFNAQKVLQKIPGDNDPAQDVNEVLTQFLKEKRYGNDLERAPRKKKNRLTIEPGKSVTADNATSSEDEDQDNPPQLSDDEDDNAPIEDVVEEVRNYIKPTSDLLVPNTFVLAKYLQGKRKSVWFKYVCVVKEKYSDSEFTVAGLKSVNSDHSVFSLVKNDISTIPLEDILAVLPNPTINKEMHYQFPHKIDVFEL